MNRIDAVFKRLKQEQKMAFIGFLTAGDPDIPTCMECVKPVSYTHLDVYKSQTTSCFNILRAAASFNMAYTAAFIIPSCMVVIP